MAKKSYYIKERHNPQFKEPYYSAQGQLSKTEVKMREKDCLYGVNIYLEYETIELYNEALKVFKIS